MSPTETASHLIISVHPFFVYERCFLSDLSIKKKMQINDRFKVANAVEG